MNDTGYTTRPVGSLSTADLLEEVLQSAYDSGYYAAKPGDHLYARLGQVAIDRRNQCFAEIKRRLEVAEAQAEAASQMLSEAAQYGDSWSVPQFLEDEPTVAHLRELTHRRRANNGDS